LVKLLFKPFHRDLHQILSQDKLVRDCFLRYQEVHGSSQVLDTFNKLFGFFSAFFEEESELSVGRTVGVPLHDQGPCVLNVFHHHRLGERVGRRGRYMRD
ncbi:Exocyst complex component EXO70A1 like, partial [Actinidia chinensis var. chinensis]